MPAGETWGERPVPRGWGSPRLGPVENRCPDVRGGRGTGSVEKDAAMLNVAIKPHRPYLRAQGGAQKLFVMLKLLPAPEAGRGRPRVDLAVIIDTSGSMREPAPGAQGEVTPTRPFTMDGKTYNATFEGASKLDVAMDAARRLLESSHLQPEDCVSLIQFDD